MLTIKLKGESYKIPNDLSEYTIKHFTDIMSVEQNEDKYERITSILNEVFDIPLEFINRLPAKTILYATEIINECIGDINVELREVFDFNGKKYKYHEATDLLRWDQFVDLCEMTKDKDQIVKNLHLINALLYGEVNETKKERRKLKTLFKKRKEIYKTKAYNINDVFERATEFKQLPLEIAYGTLFFFHRLRLEYLKITLASLKETEK